MMRMGSTPGRSGAMLSDFGKSVDADLLDLERHRVCARCQPSARRRHVVPAADDGFVRDEAGRAGGFGVHHAHAIAHGARGHRRHAPQLAAAQNSDQAAGADDVTVFDYWGRYRATQLTLASS